MPNTACLAANCCLERGVGVNVTAGKKTMLDK